MRAAYRKCASVRRAAQTRLRNERQGKLTAMPDSSPDNRLSRAVSAKRVLALLALVIGIPVAVVGVFAVSTYVADGRASRWFAREGVASRMPPPVAPATFENARKQLREGLVIVAPNVPPAPHRPPLQPGDEFYRQLQAGILADSGALGMSDGEATHAQMRRFVRQGDVLARRLHAVREYGPGWNLFGGSSGAAWQEYIHWCIRLRYEPGEENEYAYALWRLGNEPFGESLGLPRLGRDLSIMPGNAANHIEPLRWQGLLIPLQTLWHGEGKYSDRTIRRSWQILPDSPICDTARAAAEASARTPEAVAR